MELPPGDEHTEGSYANRAVALQTPEGKLREWVEEHYVPVSLCAKDTGTKLEALYGAYASATPPVHAKVLGRNTFAKMLGAVYAAGVCLAVPALERAGRTLRRRRRDPGASVTATTSRG